MAPETQPNASREVRKTVFMRCPPLQMRGHVGSMRQKAEIPPSPHPTNGYRNKGLHPDQKKGRLTPSFP
jgi:hypothetical protein